MKLYELPAAFAEAEALTTDDGELTPEAFEKLTALEIELDKKVDGCCRVMRHFEAQAAAYKAEADRLTHHRTVAENNADRASKRRGADAAGASNNNAKLTAALVAEIRQIHARGGASCRGLGERFGVGRNAINQVVRGLRWPLCEDA